MSSRTRVPEWKPPFREALRLAWRPALAYDLFAFSGMLVFLLTTAWFKHDTRELAGFSLGLAFAAIGLLGGQALSLLRLRAEWIIVVTGLLAVAVVWMIEQAHAASDFVMFPVIFFFLAFPCGLLSLVHRYELFASFWPGIGWIGSVFIYLNEHSRVTEWREDKIAAWMPIPLAMLAGFLVLWLFYLSAKQAARVDMWQALSGAAERRVSAKRDAKDRSTAVPRKNVLPLLAAGVVLFGAVALLAPYLWRTGRGERTDTQVEAKPNEKPEGPPIDAEGLARQLQQLANAATAVLPKLWPLLFLLLAYRPVKRALLLTHLKTPVVPTPPSERIDNLWEYIRIAAEDAGAVPTSSDSVEAFVRRVEALGRSSPALANAAEIYVRTRYGFVVQRGDAQSMRMETAAAAAVLRKDRGAWKTLASWWRPLS